MAIFKDEFGILVSDTAHDGGDSARAHGMMNLFGGNFTDPFLISHFVERGGFAVRHPIETPWNNRNNFTRDQLMCLAAGLWNSDCIVSGISIKSPGLKIGINVRGRARDLFWTHFKRAFFAQNIERDFPGTRKSLLPKYYKAGQRFDDITIMKESKWVFRPDYRDPLWIHHICHLIKSCRISIFYFLLPLGWPFLFLSIVFNSRKLNAEQNQIISMVVVAGKFWVKLYKFCNPMWKAQVYHYWAKERNFVEMSNLIIDGLEKIV